LNINRSITQAVAASAIAGLVTACGSGAQGPPNISTVNVANYGVLQFAVGTVNLSGTTALNVVSTYRQSNGKSATGVNAPVLTGPFVEPASVSNDGGANGDPFATFDAGGPSVEDVAASTASLGYLGSTPQSVRPDAPVCDSLTACSGGTPPNTSTFGQSGGVFANGFQPANSTNNGVPYSYVPYGVPLFTPAITAWGGPPTFDPDKNGMGVRDGNNNLGDGVLGVNEGVFAIDQATPTGAATPFTLTLTVPTGINNANASSSYATLSANFTLTNFTGLPTVVSPVPVEDGLGGLSFPGFALPAGATEALIQVTDYGPADESSNCQGEIGATSGVGPVYYTLLYKAGGATPTLGDANGPNSSAGVKPGAYTPSPSICTGAQNAAANGGTATPDTYSVTVIAADYPLYESNLYANASQTPTIVATGSTAGTSGGVAGTGSADLTISTETAYVYGQGASPDGVMRNHIKAKHNARAKATSALRRS
jgi:hypothetical protein